MGNYTTQHDDELSWRSNQYGEEISWNSEEYDPGKHGAVIAIRIFYDKLKPCSMAELAFAFGGTCIIDWTNIILRERFKKGITGYTLMYDTRITDYEETIKELDYRFRHQIRKESYK